jgi:hypothetical protein
MSDDEGREAGLELALMLTGKMAADAAFTTNSLIDGLEQRAKSAEAELRAVRAQVEELCSGPYAPSTAALMKALWPSQDSIDYFDTQPTQGPAILVHAWEGGTYGGDD